MRPERIALGVAIGAFVSIICALAGVGVWPMVVLAFLASLIVGLVMDR